MTEKKALFIGINYVNNPAYMKLDGCWSDVVQATAFLKEEYDFEDDCIRVLMDDGQHEDPDRQTILDALEWLVGDAESGDTRFFHFRYAASRG